MTVLAHTRDGVVVRATDLYEEWADALSGRRAPDFDALPDDVRAAWEHLATRVQAVIAYA